MSRTINPKTSKQTPIAKPKSVEVDNSKIKKRIILFILFLTIGLGCFGYGLYSYYHREEGWYQIDGSSAKLNCSDNYVFYEYCLDNKEYTSASKQYSNACVNAYTYFDSDCDNSAYNNIYYLNHHLDQDVVLIKEVYDTLKYLYDINPLYVFSQPIYYLYQRLFVSYTTSQSYSLLLPSNNIDTYQDILNYVNSNSIRIDFKDNNTVNLHVDEEYKEYIDAYELPYIGYSYLEYAVKLDYIVNYLENNNIKSGYIYSKNGTLRKLSNCKDISFNLFGKYNSNVYMCGTYSLDNYSSIVTIKSFINNESEINYYYQAYGIGYNGYFKFSDGLNQTKYNYISILDNDNAVNTLIKASDNYLNNIDPSIDNLNNIKYIIIDDLLIHSNIENFALTNIYNENNIQYQIVID